MQQTASLQADITSAGSSTADGGPDEIIVNEQEQHKEVNEQDDAFEGNEGEKAFSEGNMNNSDTAAKPTFADEPRKNLPGTEPDPEKATPESTGIE